MTSVVVSGIANVLGDEDRSPHVLLELAVAVDRDPAVRVGVLVPEESVLVADPADPNRVGQGPEMAGRVVHHVHAVPDPIRDRPDHGALLLRVRPRSNRASCRPGSPTRGTARRSPRTLPGSRGRHPAGRRRGCSRRRAADRASHPASSPPTPPGAFRRDPTGPRRAGRSRARRCAPLRAAWTNSGARARGRRRREADSQAPRRLPSRPSPAPAAGCTRRSPLRR